MINLLINKNLTENYMWVVAAVLSAVFAGITAILSKCGIKNINSNVATAVRTFIVLCLRGLSFLLREHTKHL